MMNATQKNLCFTIAQKGVTDFAGLSIATQMCTDRLSFTLDELRSRGFVLREAGLYKLAEGVRETLLAELP